MVKANMEVVELEWTLVRISSLLLNCLLDMEDQVQLLRVILVEEEEELLSMVKDLQLVTMMDKVMEEVEVTIMSGSLEWYSWNLSVNDESLKNKSYCYFK